MPSREYPRSPGQTTLSAGDAVRTTATGGQRITAVAPSKVRIWEKHASTH
ncbi:hypothetical protein [Nocardia mikamii]